MSCSPVVVVECVGRGGGGDGDNQRGQIGHE